MLELACRCGSLAGHLALAGHTSVRCYCHDCRAYIRWLGRLDLLDAQGGVDILQVAPRHVVISRGHHQLACVRLAPTGLFRFYASCCQTPVANAMSGRVPFVGLARALIVNSSHLASPVGINRGSAVGGTPAGRSTSELAVLGKALWLMAGWKLSGFQHPSAFFTAEGPTVAPRVLTPDERAAATID